MLHKEFWGLVFLAFVVWIFMSSDPQVRIARTCRPILWTGNVATSLTALAVPSGQASVQKWGSKFDYSCRYTVWRLIYQDDYNKFLQEQQGSAPAPQAPQAPVAPEAPASTLAPVPSSGRHSIPSDAE